VNLQTKKDKFTALHYASFRGNVELCKLLVDNGADVNVRNHFGLNVMHIAAQGDQPISLFFFKQLGMELTCKDKRGSTPLHWACFQNSEVALIYLLGWLRQDQLDIPDCDGYTALHLAVKSSEQLKSGRPLRALLMRGASRESRDKKGKRPVDLTPNIKCESLQRELRASLEEDSRCECLMLKSSLKKTEKSIKMPIAFLVFFDSVFVVLILFLFPSKYTIHANSRIV